MASLRKYFEHTGIIFVIAFVVLPALIVAAHFVKIFLKYLQVDALEREIFDFVSLALTLVDAVLILSTAVIGVYRLLETEVDE